MIKLIVIIFLIPFKLINLLAVKPVSMPAKKTRRMAVNLGQGRKLPYGKVEKCHRCGKNITRIHVKYGYVYGSECIKHV